jgi:hypothetical protein
VLNFTPLYRAKILDYPGCRTKSVLYLIAGRSALGRPAGPQAPLLSDASDAALTPRDARSKGRQTPRTASVRPRGFLAMASTNGDAITGLFAVHKDRRFCCPWWSVQPSPAPLN